MAVELNLLHFGGLFTLSTLDDARRSSITGTTLNGPNGSGQFYPVYQSTVTGATFQVRLASTTLVPSTLVPVFGILQNTPGPGGVADIGFIGISKAIAGSTGILQGSAIQPSSSVAGLVVPTVAGMGPPIGVALENPTSTGQVISVFISPSINAHAT